MSDTQRLNYEAVRNSQASTLLPNFDPSQHKSGIVHLGIGAFHRAHQAVFTEEVLRKNGGDWRIIGVSMRKADIRDQMAPQDYLYSVTEKLGEEKNTRLITAIEKVLVASEQAEEVVSAIASPSTHIVSITVTEKGYCLKPGTSDLDLNNPQLKHDIQNPTCPKTVPGLITAACAQRKQNGDKGMTVISCDNLPHNGELTNAAVLSFATILSPDLAEWISKNVSFCNTMVDRIVPAPTDDTRAEARQALALDDYAAIECEPFRQWVIQDNFAGERPKWEDVGAQIVEDVAPYEVMKLRTLNGCHSALAYTGCLLGHSYIHEAVNDELLGKFVAKLMDEEIQPTLDVPQDINIDDYKKTVIQRFSNSAVPYRCLQVASDGSQKLIQRILKPAESLYSLGRPVNLFTLIIAAWFRYLEAKREDGKSYTIADPIADELIQAAAADYDSTEARVHSLMSVAGIFSKTLVHNGAFMRAVIDDLETIRAKGLRLAIQEKL